MFPFFIILITKIIRCEEICFDPIIANLFGNCYLDGAGTINCPNEATPNSLSLNFTYGTGISNLGAYNGISDGKWYIEGGSIVDSGEIIKAAEPEFIALSVWVDPNAIFTVSIYNIEFEFQGDNDIKIDDGIIASPIICQKCYEYSADFIHIIVKTSTPYNDDIIMGINVDGKSVFFSELLTMEFSTTTAMDLEWGALSEKFFKTSFYVGDLPHEICDTLTLYGAEVLDNQTCVENISCVSYADLLDCYDSLAIKSAALELLSDGCNETAVLEQIQRVYDRIDAIEGCNQTILLETGQRTYDLIETIEVCNDTLLLEANQRMTETLDTIASSSECCFPYTSIEGQCIEITCWNISYNSRLVCSGYGVCTGIDSCECYGGYTGSMCEIDVNGTCTELETGLVACEQALNVYNITYWRWWSGIGVLILIVILAIIFITVMICLITAIN